MSSSPLQVKGNVTLDALLPRLGTGAGEVHSGQNAQCSQVGLVENLIQSTNAKHLQAALHLGNCRRVRQCVEGPGFFHLLTICSFHPIMKLRNAWPVGLWKLVVSESVFQRGGLQHSSLQ